MAAGLSGLTACATPLDMGAERTALPGPEWGVVIGSVLVLPEADDAGGFSLGRDAARRTYQFEVVQIEPGDPYGTKLTGRKYDLTAKAGEERVFVSRLRPGEYLLRAFRDAGVAGLGGELDVILSAGAGEVRYVGRLQLHVPHNLSRGKGFHFTIDNVRPQTLGQVATQRADLVEAVVDAPMQTRMPPVP